MGLLDFLADWTIASIIEAALVVAVLCVAGSFGLAVAWRRWKERRRAEAASARRSSAAAPPGPPGAASPQPGRAVRFAQLARVTKARK